MIKNKEKFYNFLEECIDGKQKFGTNVSVKNIKINVLKFQNNFSSLLTYTTEIKGITFIYVSRDKTKGSFTIGTNHKDSNKQYIHNIIYDRSTKIFHLRSDYSSFQTFIYTDEEKDIILRTVNRIRLDSIEEHINKITKIQANFSKLIINSELKPTL